MDKVLMKDGFKEGLDFALEQLERQLELFEEENMLYEKWKVESIILELKKLIDNSTILIEEINN